MSYRPDASISLILSAEGQAKLGARSVCIVMPGVSTTMAFYGASSINTQGTISHPNPTSGSPINSRWKTLIATAAGAGSTAGFGVNSDFVSRGSGTAEGGFRLTVTFGIGASPVTNQRGFVGLTTFTNMAAIPNANPSAQTNIIGVGYDSGDTNLFIMHNDGAGAATKVDLGANFPVGGTAAIYQAEFWCAPNDSKVFWKVILQNDGTTAEGEITTELPSSTTYLKTQNWINNGTTASSVSFAFFGSVCQWPA